MRAYQNAFIHVSHFVQECSQTQSIKLRLKHLISLTTVTSNICAMQRLYKNQIIFVAYAWINLCAILF